MSDRSERVSKLLKSQESRASYIKSKLAVLVPAQIRSLRLKSIAPPMPYQRDLARATGLHQSRISMFETPGAANITLETIAKIAAGLRVGVVLKFVPFSEMLRWENSYSPEADVTRLLDDNAFLNPAEAENEGPIGLATQAAASAAPAFELPPAVGDNRLNAVSTSGRPYLVSSTRPPAPIAASAVAPIGG